MALAFRRGFRTSPHVFGTNNASMCAMLGLKVQFECRRLELEIRLVCAQLAWDLLGLPRRRQARKPSSTRFLAFVNTNDPRDGDAAGDEMAPSSSP